MKFRCRICGKSGSVACATRSLPFLHCRWYIDYKGLIHSSLYCRSCGTVYDTVGSYSAPIAILFGRLPSKIIATFRFPAIKKLTRINNSDCPSLRSMNPYIINVMEEDGRLIDDETLKEPTEDFLIECLKDENFIIRKEAIIALRRFKGKKGIDPLIEALNDKHWDVRRNAAITLGEMGDKKALEPLNKLLDKELWEHLVREEIKLAINKIKEAGRD